jgi:uroporphyrin-III C-methyltransferase
MTSKRSNENGADRNADEGATMIADGGLPPVGTLPTDEEWCADDECIALVGAGPGDPGLLTVRAWRLINEADVVLYDSLTSEAILDPLTDCEVIDVGKRSEPRTSQEEIHELLRERARAGDRVVRLKGGDPVVFGRGGEEAEFLAKEGISFRVVPGVTSVVAAPELAGIPLTHRDISSSFTVITGHEAARKDESSLDWDALSMRVDDGETLIVVMGVKRLPEYVSTLVDRGVSTDTPVAMIEKATWQDQQTVTATLGSIVDAAEEADIQPPATTVIGEVVNVRDRVRERELEAAVPR